MSQKHTTPNQPLTLTNWIRQWSDDFLRPLASLLHRFGIKPNTVTFAAFILTLISALLVTSPSYRGIAAIAFLTAGFLDACDGTLARLSKQESLIGEFLDSTLDQYGDAAIYLGLVWSYLQDGNDLAVILAFVAVIGSLLVSYTRARAGWLGIESRVGFGSRFERSWIIFLGLLTGYTVPMLWILAILSNATAVQRIFYTIRVANEKQSESKN